jgi:hypothetical protein
MRQATRRDAHTGSDRAQCKDADDVAGDEQRAKNASSSRFLITRPASTGAGFQKVSHFEAQSNLFFLRSCEKVLQ